MALTRENESPLTSEEEALRRAAMLQLVNMPSPEGAKALIEALLFFLKERPQVAEEFEHVLYEPPLGPLAEAPVLRLLDDEDDLVREEAAFILYKLKIRTSSRARVSKSLAEDQSPWVRAYAAKALAMLAGAEVGEQLSEAIDNEAMPEIIARMGEAIAMTGDTRLVEVLREQADQLRARKAPVDVTQPEIWLRTCGEVALFLDALAAKLSGEAPEPITMEDLGGGALAIQFPDAAKMVIAGGVEQGGYCARLQSVGGNRVLNFDSPLAKKLVDALP